MHHDIFHQPTFLTIDPFRAGKQQHEVNCNPIWRDISIDWNCYTFTHDEFPKPTDMIDRDQLIVAVAFKMALKPEITHSVNIGSYHKRTGWSPRWNVGPVADPSGFDQVAIII